MFKNFFLTFEKIYMACDQNIQSLVLKYFIKLLIKFKFFFIYKHHVPQLHKEHCVTYHPS